MASVADICNRALGFIGANKINAITDQNENARACQVIYYQLRDGLIEEHDWNFASRRAILTKDTTAPIGSDFNYRYHLPTSPKCLVIREIVGNEAAEYQIEADEDGDYLLTNESSVTIRYSAQIEDTSLYTEAFINALASKMALELSLKLKGSPGTFDRMGSLSTVYGRKARGTNMKEKRPKSYGESERTPWSSAGR